MTNTATFPTRNGGCVTATKQPEDGGRYTFRGECSACGVARTEGNTLHVSFTGVCKWAQAHADACTALPDGYVDYAAKATEHLNLAFVHLGRIASGGPEKDMAEACLRAAEVYAQLDRNRKTGA